MTLEELNKINAAALDRLARGGERPDMLQVPFYGFYEVDLFESPPFVMFTAADCPRAADILYHRHFEPTSMRLWCRLVPLATGIFDVGAHVGVYSLAAAAIRQDIRIQAFEPNPYAFSRLRLHKLINRFDTIVENRVALAHKSGHAVFSWWEKEGSLISSGGTIARKDASRFQKIVVDMAPLDTLPAATTIGPRGLIKIDVEGAEGTVFEGMTGVLAHRPDIILESFSASICAEINARVLPLGYRVYLIREREGDLVPQLELQARAADGDNFNQFLSVRDPRELEAIMA